MPFDTHWKSKYETGHTRIDFEHRVFLGLIEQFAAEADQGADPRRLRRTATEILKYADFHFFSEENIMLNVGYPDFDHHHALHQALLAELRAFIESVALDSWRAGDMVEFLVKWFVGHTANEDLKLAQYAAA
ncbi:MAG: bacteriohemerythrin [Bacteroidales bacterium]